MMLFSGCRVNSFEEGSIISNITIITVAMVTLNQENNVSKIHIFLYFVCVHPFHEKEGNLVKTTFWQHMHFAPIIGNIEGYSDHIDIKIAI